jgi:glycosyltransferase involved in cell wall biosynthesis
MASVRVSVVIASIVGPPFIDDCLGSIERQTKTHGAEVIVVSCGGAWYAERIARKFPWVRVIHCAERETVPDLRRRAVEQAAGELVAVIEEHCLAAPDWLDRAVEAYAGGDYGVVGGPVVDHAYARLRDWVVYFIEYNNYFPPWRAGEWRDLGSANIAYSRELLLSHRELLTGGYWEAGLHPQLIAEGVKFRPAPEMKVHHRGPFNYAYYLGQRYWFSRAFAGRRSRDLSSSKKLVYVIASPLVPFVLLARIMKRVRERNCRFDMFAKALPLVIPALFVYVCGETVGYLAGPGDALMKVE